jgi:hypothetical protein
MLLLFGLLLLESCNRTSEPQKVLKDFFKAISSRNIEQAKQYATADSDMMLQLAQMEMQDTPDSSYFNKYSPDQLSFGKPVINGNTAFVPVGDKRQQTTINWQLVKENNQWKVAFTMAAFKKMADDKVKELGLDKMQDSAERQPIDTAMSIQGLQHENK